MFHLTSKLTEFAKTIYLNSNDLPDPEGFICDNKAKEIALSVERLRSRSVASRYLSIIGRLRAEVQKFGATIEGVGTHRAISVRLPDDHLIWAYPVLGVPNAETMNEIEYKALSASHSTLPVLLYDHIGIRCSWKIHLEWLRENIKTVRMMKISEAAWSLADWED